jgi:uncharacterized protein
MDCSKPNHGNQLSKTFIFASAAIFMMFLQSSSALGQGKGTHTDLHLAADDMIPTGNEWIALPTIRASDGSILNFNVLSVRDRGLLQVDGDRGGPAVEPYFLIDKKRISAKPLTWELLDYWIPRAHTSFSGLDATVTYCAPHGIRAAFIQITVTNRGASPISTGVGLNANWGALNRVTYTPVALNGERKITGAPWNDSGRVFSFVTSDTHFAWSVYFPNSTPTEVRVPLSVSPRLETQRNVTLAPGESMNVHFVLGIGVEEYSASQASQALEDMIDRLGPDQVIEQAAVWCRKRARTTGQADLDVLMNRNFLFTAFYAWGKSIDTEQVVGVTSRSPRYYVSAAYWDRDAMLWSFPGLLDIDDNLAREALEYALTTQLRNTGTHSRFIDGIVLEEGFELDEAVAPIIALGAFLKKTNERTFLMAHQDAVRMLRARMFEYYDEKTGLFWTLEDAQDQYYKQQFSIYDNVLVWKAMQEMAKLFDQLKDPDASKDLRLHAEALRTAILKYGISDGAPGAGGPIFNCATDGKSPIFADVPPGSLLKLAILDFVAEDDPVFTRTYNWLHSANHKYSYSNAPYGLPGSYRLPFTTAWSVADHLALTRGRSQALRVLRASKWDGGIITEGVDPATAAMDYDGRAFATAAGYVAHAVCEAYCQPQN